MTDNPSLRKALRAPLEGGWIARARAKALADTVGESNLDPARHNKGDGPKLGRVDSQNRKISPKAPPGQLAPAPAQCGNPSALAMSGDDFYRAACIEAHRLLNLP